MNGRLIQVQLYKVMRYASGQVNWIAPDSNLIVICVKNFVLIRVLLANGHWARIDCASKSNKSCLTIHPKVCSKVAQKLPPKFKKVAYFWKSFCSRLLLKTWRCICNLLAVQKVAENTKSCSKVAEHNLLIPNDHSVIFLFQWIMYWTFLSIHSRSFLEADYLGLLIPEWNIFGIHLRIFKNWIIG